MAEVSRVKLPPGDCESVYVMISNYWFRKWLGAARQHAITWANVGRVLCRHVASLCHKVLTYRWLREKKWLRTLMLLLTEMSMKTAICHDAKFVVTSGTGNYHNDNLKCRQSWHGDNSRFSVRVIHICMHHNYTAIRFSKNYLHSYFLNIVLNIACYVITKRNSITLPNLTSQAS